MIFAALLILSTFVAPKSAQVATAHNDVSSDTVYVFLSPSCPVCKASTGALRELQKANTTVAFVGIVDPAIADSAEVAEFYADYKLTMAVRWDSPALAARFKATVTPEVVVLHNGKKVYQGRINNQFAALGKKRRVVTEHDLRDVLDVLARGAVPSFRRTIPVGCYLEK